VWNYLKSEFSDKLCKNSTKNLVLKTDLLNIDDFLKIIEYDF